MTGQMHKSIAEHGACPILSKDGSKKGNSKRLIKMSKRTLSHLRRDRLLFLYVLRFEVGNERVDLECSALFQLKKLVTCRF